MSDLERKGLSPRGAQAPENRRKRPRDGELGTGRRSIRDDIVDVDRDILRLLLRRRNLLEKISTRGRVDAADEKYLREAWQQDVARVSRDAELSGRFFSLMQQVEFLPRPSGQGAGVQTNQPGSARREAFNLAPPRQAVNFSLNAPLDCGQTQAWLYLACAAGAPMRLAPALQNDPVIDCVKALNQLGASLTREDEAILVRGGEPATRPDKVIHLGDSEFNFYLFIAHYLGRYSRVKFTGGTDLKLADFTCLRHVLPELGARLVHVVPKSCGLPARLECSGMLPPEFKFGPELPAAFAEALILAASFYEQPFGLDLSKHPERESVFARILPMLDACGAVYVISPAGGINLEPATLSIPPKPNLPLDPLLGSFMVAFASVLGGEATLKGQWPEWPDCGSLWTLLASMDKNWQRATDGISLTAQTPLQEYDLATADATLLEKIPPAFVPLFASLAACAALRGGKSTLPQAMANDAIVIDFLHSAGLEARVEGDIAATGNGVHIWNAPTPAWAMAMALAACARPGNAGFPLGNPGIMTSLWPMFWVFYNSLPNPTLKKPDEPAPAPNRRRRILTTAIAQVPELKDEDL